MICHSRSRPTAADPADHRATRTRASRFLAARLRLHRTRRTCGSITRRTSAPTSSARPATAIVASRRSPSASSISHGILRELSQAEEGAERLPDLSLLDLVTSHGSPIFIKLTAITGTSATLASCGNPEHQLIRFVPDEDLVPGVAEWKPSVCPLCAAGCGVTVRVMEADVETTRNGQAGVVRMGLAKKLEGNPTHPINQGGLCARGQAAIQITYHPDRLTQPLKRIGRARRRPVQADHLGRGDRGARGAARRAGGGERPEVARRF